MRGRWSCFGWGERGEVRGAFATGPQGMSGGSGNCRRVDRVSAPHGLSFIVASPDKVIERGFAVDF